MLRAFKDTFSHFLTLIIALIAGVIGLFVLYLVQGEGVVFDEIPYAIAGFIGSVGAVVLMFFFNLACAPYRNERDKLSALKSEIGVADERELSRLMRQDSFFLWEAACLLAGVPPQYPVKAGGAPVYLEKLKLEFLNGRLNLVDDEKKLERLRQVYNISKLFPDFKPPKIDDNAIIMKEELVRYAGDGSLEIKELGLSPSIVSE